VNKLSKWSDIIFCSAVEDRGRAIEDTFENVEAHHCSMTVGWASPEAPCRLLHAALVQFPPIVGPAICLAACVVCTKNCCSEHPVQGTAIGINYVSNLRGTSQSRTLDALVQARVLMVGDASRAPYMPKPLGEGRGYEAQSFGVEHALRLVNVAVRHVHDANIPRPIKVPEGHLRQNRLHVCVIKLKALGDSRKVLGNIVGVCTDDCPDHVSLPQLG